MNTDAPAAGAVGSQFGTALPPSTLPPPPNPDGIALGGPVPTPSSPVDAGATSAVGSGPVPPPVAGAILMTTHVTPILDAFEAQLGSAFAEMMGSAKTYVDKLVADFEAALNSGHAEIAAITDELRRGSVVGRLGSLEMAVASHAAPALAGAGDAIHDGHDILQSWFNGIKNTFVRVVAGVAEDKRLAAEAAAGGPPATPPAPPPTPPVSPAQAQVAAMGIPTFQPPPRL